MSEDVSLKQWWVSTQTIWPSPPSLMSVSQLHALENCPRQWVLQHGDYPEIWDGHGYPRKLHIPALTGTVVHLTIESVIRALNTAGCCVLDDSLSTRTMQTMGGYTNVVQSCIEHALQSYNNNPRVEPVLQLARTTLHSQIPEIRSKVQVLLRRIYLQRSVKKPVVNKIAKAHTGQQSPLPPGIHPEVDLLAPTLKWCGKADLVIITQSEYEIVDFKTGDYSERHEFQMRVYALLWYNDLILNPTSRLADKLTLSYLGSDIQVPAPDFNSLKVEESELNERTKRAIDSLALNPPKAELDIARCQYCDVRHLCDEYWNLRIAQESARIWTRDTQFLDAEVILSNQHGPLSWSATVEDMASFDKGTPVLLRIPTNHYLTRLAKSQDRLRILDAMASRDTSQQTQSLVLTLSSKSEAYVLDR